MSRSRGALCRALLTPKDLLVFLLALLAQSDRLFEIRVRFLLSWTSGFIG